MNDTQGRLLKELVVLVQGNYVAMAIQEDIVAAVIQNIESAMKAVGGAVKVTDAYNRHYTILGNRIDGWYIREHEPRKDLQAEYLKAALAVLKKDGDGDEWKEGEGA